MKKRLISNMQKRRGKCYLLAGERIREIDPKEGAVLVHGTIRGRDNRTIGHAWVEWPDADMAWEPITDAYFRPLDEFHEAFDAQPRKNYSHEEALIHVLVHEHWGPWCEEMETENERI
jgi:hypothetical protein